MLFINSKKYSVLFDQVFSFQCMLCLLLLLMGIHNEPRCDLADIC